MLRHCLWVAEYTIENSWMTELPRYPILQMTANNLKKNYLNPYLREYVTFDKSAVRLLTGVITGHCAIAPMLQRWRIPTSSLCRSCNDTEEIETIQHFLCDCPGLQIRRQKHLGSRFFNNLADIAEMKLSHLLDFIRSSKWLTGVYNQQYWSG